MARPSHFEIPIDDPDRAEAFYRTVFGWSFHRYDGAPEYYGLATTGDEQPGINGALFKRAPEAGTTLTMGVESIEDTVAVIRREGGTVVREKSAIPGMGWHAICEDTEGNRIGLFSHDPAAG